jgi:hypothetical protein
MRPYLITRIVVTALARMGVWIGYMFIALGMLAVCSLLAG